MDPITKQIILKALIKPHIPLFYGLKYLYEQGKKSFQTLGFSIHALFFWFPIKQFSKIEALGIHRRERAALEHFCTLSIPAQLSSSSPTFYETVSYIETSKSEVS